MNITKERVGKLTPEQQEALATAVILKVREHGRLLRTARGASRSYLFMQGISLAAVLGVMMYYHSQLPTPLVFCLAGLVVIIYNEIVSSHRRMDALFKLWEADQDDDMV